MLKTMFVNSLNVVPVLVASVSTRLKIHKKNNHLDIQ